MALLLPRGAVHHESGPDHADPDVEGGARDAESGLLELEDQIEERRSPLAAERGRPAQPGPPPLEERGLPAPATLDELAIAADREVARAALGRCVRRQPGPDVGPEGHQLRGLAQIHQLVPTGRARPLVT